MDGRVVKYVRHPEWFHPMLRRQMPSLFRMVRQSISQLAGWKMTTVRCTIKREINLPESKTKLDQTFDPSGFHHSDDSTHLCLIRRLSPSPHSCPRCSLKPRPASIEDDLVESNSSYPAFKLPPIPPESSFLKHTRFHETLIGCLDFHDYQGGKYYRKFQSFVDFDIIRRFIPCNLCQTYPDETIRYFALNWPEYCIMAFTDTHIPIGIIMAHQVESRKARISMFVVEKRVDRNDVYQTLLNLIIQRFKENCIQEVILSPESRKSERQLSKVFSNFGPLKRINANGEYEFLI
ncbi:hypothetical protein Aperf_G00000096237 [Anoplocephala perfoliata]